MHIQKFVEEEEGFNNPPFTPGSNFKPVNDIASGNNSGSVYIERKSKMNNNEDDVPF